MNRLEIREEASRLRLERERLVAGSFPKSAADWDRLSCINLRLRTIEPSWQNPWMSGGAS